MECEACGRLLADGRPDPAGFPPLEGLEPTLAPPADAPADVVPGLEVTSHAPVGLPRAETVPDLEPTPAAPVDVSVEPLAGMDRSLDGLPDDAPTPLPALVVCRYCRTEAALGERICARCGMRLPALALVPTPPALEEAQPRTCSCGTPVRGSRCPSCGARLASS
jgi:hypothetical protein